MQERRRSERIKALLDNKYTKVKGCVTIQSTGITNDISKGGICVKLGKMVKRKDILLLELNSTNQGKLSFLAEVVWARPSDIYGRNLCGLRFLWVSSEDLLRECINYAGTRSAA